MQQFTDYGKSVISDVARRYGLSEDTVVTMLYAVMNGGGTMAQFNCPELGGSGQWMQGGMTMVGDMFNYSLKATVDNLCYELSGLLSGQQPLFLPPPKAQSRPPAATGTQQQSQGSGSYQSSQQQGYGQTSFFVPGGGGNWWPQELGMAASTGAQNNLRYAVFPQARRLAIEVNGHVTVYDTLDHQIGGVGQQQGYGASFTFTSQYGTVLVDQLPVVSIDGEPPSPVQPVTHSAEQAPVESSHLSATAQSVAAPSTPEEELVAPLDSVQQSFSPQGFSNSEAPAAESDIFATIEKLAGLRDRGILSDEEFAAKKAELLKRI